MDPKFNINRPKISDEEIKQHQEFDKLVKQFKEQSLKKARGDESWWKNKQIKYATVIAGVAVVCTVTYRSLLTSNKKQNQTHETVITSKKNTPSSKPSTAFINAPSQALKINYTRYTLNAAKGATINHSSGSKINIPQHAFVNKAGVDIQGEVTIDYREFHDVADIIASGIPMNYDSAGAHYHFQSAGMFDMVGTQNGEPVFIKNDKKLLVNLASANPGTFFNQYYLDTIARNWQYLKRDEPHALKTGQTQKHITIESPQNKKTLVLKNQIEVVIPKRIDSVKTVYNHRIEKLPLTKQPAKPAKATPGRPTFKIDGSYDEYPELAAFDNVIFEVGAENKNYTKELHEVTWSDVKVSPGPDKGRNYLLTLIYRQRREQLIVYPVLNGLDFEKAQKTYQEKFTQYQQSLEKKQADEKRLIAEMEARQAALIAQQKKQEEELRKEQQLLLARYNMAEKQELANSFNNLSNTMRATRLFEVARFGVYNSDCAKQMLPGQSLTPVFVLNQKDKPLHPTAVYFVNYSQNTVIMLDKTNGFNFNYNPSSVYSLCVFEKNNVYLCNKNVFKQLAGQSGAKFTVTRMQGEEDNLLDFKKALEL